MVNDFINLNKISVKGTYVMISLKFTIYGSKSIHYPENGPNGIVVRSRPRQIKYVSHYDAEPREAKLLYSLLDSLTKH